MFRDTDQKYMSLALRLARRAEGMTSPNPVVGAVLVKEGKVIGRGYHKKAGFPHAEIEALLDAEKKGYRVSGSTLYVTLEPCCHRDKRTPPCVEAIIRSGISRVVVGTLDFNPKVKGKGIEILAREGIDVRVGILEERCREINEAFFKYITTKLPFVILKLAATIDGKIATFTGDSKWIGSERQRRYAHKLRSKVDAIMTGIGTVLQDDPQLNVRLGKGFFRQPVPVILDSNLRIPLESRIFKVHVSPIIATTSLASLEKLRRLEDMGVRVIVTDKDESGRVDLVDLVKKLGEMEITSVMIEGGSEVAATSLKKGVVDKVVFFYAPKIIGADGVSMIGKLNISRVGEAIPIERLRLRSIGEEFLVEGYLRKHQIT
ncbi:Riboflavin biosynthesis protein RibD [bacterium HR37]|nr:Riboflavin biosynthesis protein RibD [bacterium HR37]